MSKKARRKYTAEFKRDAVKLVTEQGYGVTEAARNLGINDNVLRRWKHNLLDEQAGTRLPPDEYEELRRLRDENRRLKMEREILKKAAAFFAKESS